MPSSGQFVSILPERERKASPGALMSFRLRRNYHGSQQNRKWVCQAWAHIDAAFSESLLTTLWLIPHRILLKMVIDSELSKISFFSFFKN